MYDLTGSINYPSISINDNIWGLSTGNCTQAASSSTSTSISIEYAWDTATNSCSNVKIYSNTGCATSTTCDYPAFGVNFEFNSNSNWNNQYQYFCRQPTLKERFSEIIKSRCSPNILTKRKTLQLTSDIREQRARETLKRIIGQQKFIGFIKHGFISVKGKSGLVYQIFPGSGITHVFDKGNLIERLCVVLKGNFPPTDSLVMRFLLIINNEQQFRSLSIKHSIYKSECSHLNGPVETKPLAEIFNLLKNKVA